MISHKVLLNGSNNIRGWNRRRSETEAFTCWVIRSAEFDYARKVLDGAFSPSFVLRFKYRKL